MLSTDDFTKSKEVSTIVQGLQNLGKELSDVKDDEGHQYVDLVMEGGGVLGVALVGYTYALEQAGIRFAGIAGTSAGAINALALSAAAPPQAPRTVKVLDALARVDLWSFMDGHSDSKDFMETALQRPGWARLVWKGVQVIDELQDHLGLNPGAAFESWLDELLKGWGIETTEQLLQRINDEPKGLTVPELGARLAVIAADITTESKVTFPEMASLYWPGQDVRPARYVRASMSIPLVFFPYRVGPVSQDAAKWKQLVSYEGELPKEVLFVDGGILSNFPIGAFHVQGRLPRRPTFGVKLGVDRAKPRQVEAPGALLGSVFDAARHALDFDFLLRHPDYRHLVATIPTEGPRKGSAEGRNWKHNWLNFAMEDDEKLELFKKGVRAAENFLNRFDWEHYKQIRRQLMTAHASAPAPPSGQ